VGVGGFSDYLCPCSTIKNATKLPRPTKKSPISNTSTGTRNGRADRTPALATRLPTMCVPMYHSHLYHTLLIKLANRRRASEAQPSKWSIKFCINFLSFYLLLDRGSGTLSCCPARRDFLVELVLPTSGAALVTIMVQHSLNAPQFR